MLCRISCIIKYGNKAVFYIHYTGPQVARFANVSPPTTTRLSRPHSLVLPASVFRVSCVVSSIINDINVMTRVSCVMSCVLSCRDILLNVKSKYCFLHIVQSRRLLISFAYRFHQLSSFPPPSSRCPRTQKPVAPMIHNYPFLHGCLPPLFFLP